MTTTQDFQEIFIEKYKDALFDFLSLTPKEEIVYDTFTDIAKNVFDLSDDELTEISKDVSSVFVASKNLYEKIVGYIHPTNHQLFNQKPKIFKITNSKNKIWFEFTFKRLEICLEFKLYDQTTLLYKFDYNDETFSKICETIDWACEH